MGQEVPCCCMAAKRRYSDAGSPTRKNKNRLVNKTHKIDQIREDCNPDPHTQPQTPTLNTITTEHLNAFRSKNAMLRVPGRSQDRRKQEENGLTNFNDQLFIRKPSRASMKIQDFHIMKMIGRGSFGRVFLASQPSQNTEVDEKIYAIKQMKKTGIHESKLVSSLILEKIIMQKWSSNFIAKCYYAFRDEKYYYLAMEWAKGGDIFSFILPNSQRKRIFCQLGEEGIRFIIGCVILGLEELHERQIVYNDLKPENVLVFEDGYVKLSDFGLSRDLKQTNQERMRVGTRMYFAPEIVMGTECTKKVDIWALGVLTYQLSNFFFPFASSDIDDPSRFAKAILQGQKNRNWDNKDLSTELKDFINGLLKFQSRIRLGASGWGRVKNHDFFKKVNFDWKALKEKKMASPLLPILEQKIQYKSIQGTKIKEDDVDTGDSHSETIEGWSSQCSSCIH